MFCKRKIEFEIINTDRQNFNLSVEIKGTFSTERLKNSRCSMKKLSFKSLFENIDEQKLLAEYQSGFRPNN